MSSTSTLQPINSPAAGTFGQLEVGHIPLSVIIAVTNTATRDHSMRYFDISFPFPSEDPAWSIFTSSPLFHNEKLIEKLLFKYCDCCSYCAMATIARYYGRFAYVSNNVLY